MHLNGGFTGLDERTLWLARWKTALGSQNPALHSTTWLQVSLDVTSGQERPGSPVVIQASSPGTGDGGSVDRLIPTAIANNAARTGSGRQRGQA